MIVIKVEDAILDALRNAQIAASASIKSYAGEFDDDVFESIRTLPAAWVTFAGAPKPKRSGARQWRTDATFVVIVAARSVRSESAARRGSPGVAGAYQMLDHAHKLLLNQDFDLPIQPLLPGAIKTLLNTRLRNEAIAAYTQEWHTAWVEKTPPEPGQMWLKQGLNYYLKPGDENADATDVVTLREAA